MLDSRLANAGHRRRPPLRPEWITLSIALFLLLFCNTGFWRQLLSVHPLTAASALGLAAAFGFLLVMLNLALTMLAWPWVLRPLITVLLVATALVSYFINEYGVMVDVGMVRNALQTDYREARDLLTVKLFAHALLLGALPAWLLWRVPIRWRPPGREVASKALVALLSLLLLAGIAQAYYQTFASVARNHRELRFLLTPLNYIQAAGSYVRHRSIGPRTVAPYGTDARLGASWQHRPRPSLTVLVIGETARADHFSLNGYGRDTNPLLARQPGLVSLRNVWSCGTETAVSLPCMFSGYGRDAFSVEKASQREGLLDILQRAGLAVEWHDNQSGCKGVCDRVPSSTIRTSRQPGVCGADGCLDEALLDGVKERLERLAAPDPLHHVDNASRTERRGDNAVLVLHMMGSHGPAYYSRYPARVAAFGPACRTSQLDQCSRQQIVDGYDNSLRYTDAVLAGLIEMLRDYADRVDTAMIYVSDHGESLGEHGLYLHGTPYLVAPDPQKHVPMLMWFADGYRRDFGIDGECLSRASATRYSHDNLFHSMLGLLDVDTAVYDRAQDMFANCRRPV
ncbi:phosphoethanolamine transferase [Cupriavidus respiraculi]|uniref:Phosphoethanolamine transferase EptA n=1 Tax=Cupriavidus respiraculi TaxID=195930 RepID=A0ABM8X6A3_9BURK|nr:phosphoethanolamine--lipid A transferase [Cupriavidus respiraculi]CAG9175478.1 Phosphoethanolamine transferase EptA [Cupriavidus respiraculi]